MNAVAIPTGAIRVDSIEEHLREVLASPLFRKAGRQTEFLRYVVEHALDRSQETLKEFSIAMKVYKRRSDYDPKVDPIVRVEASRLRARLRDYYDQTPHSPIRIELPRGSYLPQFVLHNPLQHETAAQLAVPCNITLAVTPFRDVSISALGQFFCEGLTEELLYQLAQSSALQCLARKPHLPFRSEAPDATHLVEGSVRSDGNRVRITLHVMDLHSARVVYSTVHQHELGDVFAIQETLARDLVMKITATLINERTLQKRPA